MPVPTFIHDQAGGLNEMIWDPGWKDRREARPLGAERVYGWPGSAQGTG